MTFLVKMSAASCMGLLCRSLPELLCILNRSFKRGHKYFKNTYALSNKHSIALLPRILLAMEQVAPDLVQDTAYSRQPVSRSTSGPHGPGQLSRTSSKARVPAVEEHVAWRNRQDSLQGDVTPRKDRTCSPFREMAAHGCHHSRTFPSIGLTAIDCVKRDPQVGEATPVPWGRCPDAP